VEFVRGVPSVASTGEHDDGMLFEPADPGSAWDHFRVQMTQIVAGNREGGFFVMIGRRPER
jgi:hypothetical protein